MKILVQTYKTWDEGYTPGSVRIAVMTEEPTGRCSICKCSLYASITWGPSGTQVFSRDLGKHKKGCEYRPSAPVVVRTIKTE
jgi:hypothetical protein